MMFYKEKSFRETTIGEVPRDWDIVKLKAISKAVKGRKPSKLLDEKSENAMPYLTAEYMRSNSNVQWCERDGPNIIQVKENDLLMIWDGSYSGDVFIGFEGALASTMIRITPDENVDRKFLYYFLTTKFDFLRGTTSGTGIPHVSKSIFENLLVPLPPLKEQEKIVGVLGVVDSAVELVDRVIAKTERLKKGLMQTLLTRGIGHTEYKQTPIGEIPNEWKFGKLVDSSKTKDSPVQTGPFGAQLHASDYAEDGVPLILIKNVLDGKIIDEDMPRVAEKKASELARYRLKAGDIVFSRVGSVGRAAVIRKHQEGWLVSGQMLRVRLENAEIDNDFLSYAIATNWFQKALASRTVGATRKSINTEILSNLPMVIPNLPEQRRIASILLDVDKKLELERKEKAMLEKIKRGLMNLLLTGKVRVKVD